MTFDPTTISKASNNLPPRIIISGEPKAGKTTWAAKAPSPLFIPVVGEEGCDDLRDEAGQPIEVETTPVVRSSAEMMSVLDWLETGEHSFKTVVIDSLSSYERMRWDELVKADPKCKSIEDVGGGYGKGYTMALEHFRALTQKLSSMREKRSICIVLISHVVPRAMTDAESMDQYDAYDLSLNKKVAALFQQWADFMVFASKNLYINKDQKAVDKGRKLVIHGKAHLPVGGRGVASLMPSELPLTWKDFHEAVKAAKNATKKG